MLDSDVVVANAEHDEPILWLFILVRALRHDQVRAPNIVLRDELVLDQNERFHRMLQGQFVLAHLRQDRADVQVDVAGVRHLEAVVDSLLREVQVVVFDF